MPSTSESAGDAGPAGDSSLRGPGTVLLISCYELGHQPFAVASAWAQLERAGFGVAGVDASIDEVSDEAIGKAGLVAISVPMLTALRLGQAVARRVRTANPRAHICLFGLYASMNARFLLGGVADSVIGGEFEFALVDLATALDRGGRGAALDVPGVTTSPDRPAPPIRRRLAFERPRRDGLPPLDRYARLIGPAEGEERTVGYAEASRGCLHRCLHCPITPVYDGRFFIVPRDVVLDDIEQQIAAGARHITFGDPDFMNGVGHSMAIARALHEAHPEVTFDITVKVEHILRHRERFPELARFGCIFVISAVESLSDAVLRELDKGHTREDVRTAIRIVSDAGIAMRPTFVAFTPWTSIDDYIELCDLIVDDGLVDNIDPIQLAIRLLIPPGSALLRRPLPRPWLGELVDEELGYRWAHPDPRMDTLHRDVSRAVEEAAMSREGGPAEDAARTFGRIRALAYRAAGRPEPGPPPLASRRFVPKLTEPWFCCAEPSAGQLERVTSCERIAVKAPGLPPQGGKSSCGAG